MKKGKSAISEKIDRKIVERNRRIHMKTLCFKLTSLIPSHHFRPSKDLLSQQDQLDQAATYITQLKERIDELKLRQQAMHNNGTGRDSMKAGLRPPMLEIRDLGSSIEVVLISGVQKNFLLYEIISILEEEETEVVSASFSNVGDKVFHTLHAKVKVSRVGVEISRIHQRLQELMS